MRGNLPDKPEMAIVGTENRFAVVVNSVMNGAKKYIIRELSERLGAVESEVSGETLELDAESLEIFADKFEFDADWIEAGAEKSEVRAEMFAMQGMTISLTQCRWSPRDRVGSQRGEV